MDQEIYKENIMFADCEKWFKRFKNYDYNFNNKSYFYC